MPKLACYAGSFLDFVVEHLLDDRALKVVRIGVRLIKFTLHNFDNMAEKANLVTLTATMLEMLNDPKGILRQEVSHLFLYLSQCMNMRLLLLQILRSFSHLTPNAWPVALRTVIIILLSCKQRIDRTKRPEVMMMEVFQTNESVTDRSLAVDLVGPLTMVM